MARGQHRPWCSPRAGAHRSHSRETLSLRRTAVRSVSTRHRRHGAGRAWKARRWRRRTRSVALHISMVFVRPAAQRSGVGLPLVLHILDVARSMGYQRVGVWTARENRPARRLYERAGMTLTGKTAPLRSSPALQYESSIGAQPT
ncbi:MAG TPA: GNAT family N-acetyltransferase [Gemmatimonadales bacterium]|nr:GNAT family N-acetyltransferase [Gemmatimonadales bacterium]